MNRRHFLTRTIGAVAAAFVVTKATLVRTIDYRRNTTTAIQYLTNWWWKETKGVGSHSMPRHIVVGSDLFDAYESELKPLYRFSTNDVVSHNRNLAFKSMVMYRGEKRGWWIQRIV